MKLLKQTILFASACLLVVALLGNGTCHAQRPGGGHGGLGMGAGRGHLGVRNYGWGWSRPYSDAYSIYLQGRMPLPPYFALHPPVHYSLPVPRTYGYSPYAYPGWVPTPEVEVPVQPQEILNPYVEPQAEPASGQTASRAKLIVNPFVEQSVSPREGALATVVSP